MVRERRVGTSPINTFPTTPATRVKRCAASASPSSTSTPPTMRTATAQTTESTRNQRAPLHVVLGQACVFCRISRTWEVRAGGQFPITTSPTALAPRVNRSMALRPPAAALASPFSSTRNQRAPLLRGLGPSQCISPVSLTPEWREKDGHFPHSRFPYDPGPSCGPPHVAPASSSGFGTTFLFPG